MRNLLVPNAQPAADSLVAARKSVRQDSVSDQCLALLLHGMSLQKLEVKMG